MRHTHTHKACSHSYTLNFKFKWRSALACSFIKRPATFKMRRLCLFYAIYIAMKHESSFLCFLQMRHKTYTYVHTYINSLSFYRWRSSQPQQYTTRSTQWNIKVWSWCAHITLWANTHLSNCYLQLYIIVHCYLTLTCIVYYTSRSITAPYDYMLTLPFRHLYRQAQSLKQVGRVVFNAFVRRKLWTHRYMRCYICAKHESINI